MSRLTSRRNSDMQTSQDTAKKKNEIANSNFVNVQNEKKLYDVKENDDEENEEENVDENEMRKVIMRRVSD